MAEIKDLNYRPEETSQLSKKKRDARIEKVTAEQAINQLEKQKTLKIPEEKLTDDEKGKKEIVETIDRVIDEAKAVIVRCDAVLDAIVPTFSMAGFYSCEDNPDFCEQMQEVFGVPAPGDIGDTGGSVTRDGVNLTPDLMVCLGEIAAYSPPPPSMDDLADPDKMKKDLGKDFPKNKDLWPALLVDLFYMFLRLNVKFIFSAMCRYFGGLPIVGSSIKDAIKVAANFLLILIPAGYGKLPGSGKPEDVCSNQAMIDIQNPDEIVRNAAFEMRGPKGGCDQCKKGCAPTTEQVIAAQEAIKSLIKMQNKNTKNKSSDTSLIAQLLSMKGNVIQLKATSQGVKATVLPGGEDEPFIVSGAFQETIVSFMTVLEEKLKGIDLTISNLVNLEFLTMREKELLCCFVRLVFLQFVESDLVGKDVDSFLKHGAKYKKLQPNKRTIIFLKMLQSILSFLSAQAEYNVLVQCPIFSTDFLMASVKMSLAEVLSIASNALFAPMDLKIKGWMENPTFSKVVELCPSFSWMLNIMTCSFKGLQVKVYDFLSKLWIEGNETVKSYDSYITATLRIRNLKALNVLIELVLKNTDALSHFCNIDELSSPEEIEAATQLLIKGVAIDLGTDTRTQPLQGDTEDNTVKTIMTPVFKDVDKPVGPDANDFINSQYGRGLNGELNEFNVAESLMYVSKERLNKIEEDKVANGVIRLGCGNLIKEMLRDGGSAWKELRKQNTVSHLKV